MKVFCAGRILLCIFASSFCLPAVCQTDKDIECKVSGFSDNNSDEGVSNQKGTFRIGTLQSSAQMFRPTASTPTPPILFSHSSIAINDQETDLVPFAKLLAKRGATVLVLERTVRWEPRDNIANRERPLVTCAFDWLVKQPGIDFAHFVYVGPRLSSGKGVPRIPFEPLVAAGSDPFWVPVAETEGTDYTDKLTSASGQDFVAIRVNKYLRTSNSKMAGK
jgi:hypothetical protein